MGTICIRAGFVKRFEKSLRGIVWAKRKRIDAFDFEDEKMSNGDAIRVAG